MYFENVLQVVVHFYGPTPFQKGFLTQNTVLFEDVPLNVPKNNFFYNWEIIKILPDFNKIQIKTVIYMLYMYV